MTVTTHTHPKPRRMLGHRATIVLAVPVNLALAAVGFLPCLSVVLLLTLLAGDTTETHGTFDSVGLGVFVVVMLWTAYLPLVLGVNVLIRRYSQLRSRTYWAIVIPILSAWWILWAVDSMLNALR